MRTHRCDFEPCMCHSKNTAGEEGNGKPPRNFYIPRYDLSSESGSF